VPKNLREDSILLIVKIFGLLNWQKALDLHDYSISNRLQELLGDNLYSKLIADKSFTRNIILKASKDYKKIRNCLQCGMRSFVLDSDDWRCLACGCEINGHAIGFISCPKCNSDSVIFDLLNIEFNDYIDGECCSCRNLIRVSQCKTCGSVHRYEENCKKCKSLTS
jgi:ABC-type ATPase with predicted acetyltransferase domain